MQNDNKDNMENNQTETNPNQPNPSVPPQPAEPEKVQIKFYGSENLRAKFPKAFDVAEAVATDWKNDGSFDKIPLGHPTAEAFAAEGLKKAKELEKKIASSPAVEQIAMKALTLGFKAQAELQKIREQVKAKIKK